MPKKFNYTLLDAVEILAEFQDPVKARESLAQYEKEMQRRFGPREKWPKLDSELTADERREREAKQRAFCEKRERMDVKRRRRMARLEARAKECAAAVTEKEIDVPNPPIKSPAAPSAASPAWPPFDYSASSFNALSGTRWRTTLSSSSPLTLTSVRSTAGSSGTPS